MKPGPYCPVNLPELDCFDVQPITLWRSYDDDNCEQGERINGYVQCPECGLWWPCVEEPDCWEESYDGLWEATGWWGGVVCGECDLLMIEQPDGTPEVYSLRKP